MRKNKSKKEVVSDIQLVQDADRRRALVKDVIFPFLVKTDESISYTKIFLQSFSGLVETIYEENRKRTTVGHLEERLKEKVRSLFTISNPDQKREYEKYIGFIDLLKDVSVQDLAYATELPRFIDGFLLQEKGKAKINEIPIEKLLG